MGLLPL